MQRFGAQLGLAQQGPHIAIEFLSGPCITVEVAIAALRHAERKMDVKAYTIVSQWV